MAGIGPHRTTPEGVHVRRMGQRIREALEAESRRRSQAAREKGVYREEGLTTILLELHDKYGLIPKTVRSYIQGDRRPGMIDLRTLAVETNTTMEWLMSDIPFPRK